MVEPVVDLLTGHGHKVTRVRDAGLATDDDAVVAEYALSFDLVVVTFDYDLRNRAVRGGAACLHIPPPERTAYARVQDHYSALADLLKGAPHSLVVLPRNGPPYIA
jgi:Domain of unknown function (DUF5615)